MNRLLLSLSLSKKGGKHWSKLASERGSEVGGAYYGG